MGKVFTSFTRVKEAALLCNTAPLQDKLLHDDFFTKVKVQKYYKPKWSKSESIQNTPFLKCYFTLGFIISDALMCKQHFIVVDGAHFI